MSNNNEEQVFQEGYDWGVYIQVAEFLNNQIFLFLEHNSFAKRLSTRMEHESATRFFDWIDHMVLSEIKVSPAHLEQLGFREIDGIGLPSENQLFSHPGATFFPVLLSSRELTEIVLKPERLDHFIQMTGENIPIEGEILAPYRKVLVRSQDDYILSAVERRGYNGFTVPDSVKDVDVYRKALEAFTCRPRYFDSEKEGLKTTLKLVSEFFNSLSKERVADAFFRTERIYWERQNQAGQIQKANQNRLGLGWGNHDHHTYRSSRENFAQLIQIFEKLGFVCREQFFAGEAAGWGAQVLEHPICKFVIFSDVDITKVERDHDFAHETMENRDELKTVGLWVELHGESILGAGMHHLACLVDFEKARSNLKAAGVDLLRPFSYFDFLKQAFTAIERRSVTKNRLKRLLSKNQITQDQYKAFLQTGAISSHLETIQRDQGFKGFNQDSVTVIIKSTDPRG